MMMLILKMSKCSFYGLSSTDSHSHSYQPVAAAIQGDASLVGSNSSTTTVNGFQLPTRLPSKATVASPTYKLEDQWFDYQLFQLMCQFLYIFTLLCLCCSCAIVDSSVGAGIWNKILITQKKEKHCTIKSCAS